MWLRHVDGTDPETCSVDSISTSIVEHLRFITRHIILQALSNKVISEHQNGLHFGVRRH